MTTTTPRNKRETAELRAEDFDAAASMIAHWDEQGRTLAECVDALKHHAFSIRLMAQSRTR